MDTMIEITVMLFLGGFILFGLFLIIGAIRSKELVSGEKLIAIITVVGILFLPCHEAYLDLEKTFRKPNPENMKEIYILGKLYTWYQDTAHLCNASDKKSTFFTSLIAPDGQVSRRDVCIICGKTFECHNTLKDQRRIELAIEQSEVLSLIPE